MLLAKKVSKTTAKTLAKSATTLKASIGFALQPFMEDTKLNEQLDKIKQSFSVLEKTLQDKAKDDLSDLTKEFEKTEEELNKIVKKIQGLQEYSLLAEKSLQEKLLSKINNLKEPKKDAKVQDDFKKQAEKLITETQTLLSQAKKKLKELADKAESLVKELGTIKPKMTLFILPENISQNDKQAKKLKDRLEALCQATTAIDFSSLPALGADKEKIINFLPQLHEKVKSCGQLLDQTLINLKPLFVPNAVGNGGANRAAIVHAANGIAANAAANVSANKQQQNDSKNDAVFKVAAQG